MVSVVTLVWGISPRQPSGKNIIRWLLKKRTNGSVRYCQYTSTIWLEPASERTVFLQIKNTSDKDMSGLQGKIEPPRESWRLNFLRKR
ncbi:hypothetical protein H5Q65_23625 [Escherichia coli]|nr:hypothetical protein [Escherichia coli]